MRLSAEQIKGLADFSAGEDDCFISRPEKVIVGDEKLTVVTVRRTSGGERVRLFENGMTERVSE